MTKRLPGPAPTTPADPHRRYPWTSTDHARGPNAEDTPGPAPTTPLEKCR